MAVGAHTMASSHKDSIPSSSGSTDNAASAAYPQTSFSSHTRLRFDSAHSTGDAPQSQPTEHVANPLAHLSSDELSAKGRDYAFRHALTDIDEIRAFEIGAVLARDPLNPGLVRDMVTDGELAELQKEIASRWRQPPTMFLVIILCSTCAAVQGQDETVVNGGQLFYLPQFGIENNTWLTGLINSAPYMCCALLSCWFTIPLNRWLGRRGTIFVTCMLSICGCIWQAFSSCWWHLLVARIALGLGIGPKSATVPILAAESSPQSIRGALTMQWQMWTAFGVMLGYSADLGFYSILDVKGIVGLNWRIMMASALAPALVVVLLVGLCPESPRWLMQNDRHHQAYKAMCRLRFTKIQAARDVFYMSIGLDQEERRLSKSKIKALELFTVPRNRRAMVASEICMFMQQFCGVNVIAYYSSAIFKQGGFSDKSALTASLGFGIINFIFAIPAIYTIDTFGRRNLLLTTFPLMSLCLYFTGFSFWIPPAQTDPTATSIENNTAHIACIAVGIYLFGIVYSPGEGPVPFTYSAEAYPLYIRTYGMSLATATTWFFNFVLSITWPSLLETLGPQGAFAYYATWNLMGFFAVLLFVRETKGLSLEELDQVFSVPTKKHALYGLKQVPYFFKRYIIRKRDIVRPTLSEKEGRNEFSTSSKVERGL